MMRFAPLALLIVACSSDEPPQQRLLFSGGTRLFAEHYQVGGLQQFIGFYDRERAERCAFVLGPSADGTNVPAVQYCLPTDSAALSTRYADATCQEPLAVVHEGSEASVLVEYALDPCSAQPRVFELTDEVLPAQSFELEGGACVPAEATAEDRFTLRRIGGVVPREAFVRASESVFDVSDRMGALVLRAEDGASLTVAGYDRARNESVHPFGLGYEPTQERWWPRQVAYSSVNGRYYADDACSQPLANKDSGDALCPITTVMEYTVADECGNYARDHYAAGPRVVPEVVHSRDADGRCVAEPGHGRLFVEMREQLAPEVFPDVVTTEAGDGRVGARLYATPEGQPILTSLTPFVDRERDSDCAPRRAADGSLRCLPPARGVAGFGDDGCNVPIVGYSDATACGAEVPVLVSATTDDAALEEQRWHVFEVGAATLTPAQVFMVSAGACVPHWAGSQAHTWHPATVVAADEFEPVGEVLGAAE
jgi:hypothetical protein